MSLRLAGTLSGPLRIPYSSIRFSRSPASSPRGCRVKRRGCILRASAGVVNGFSGKFSRSSRRPAGGRNKKRGSRRTPSLARSAPRERDDPAFRGLHRSTSGDGGLSCRVRHGTGRSPPPWSRSRGALPALGALRGRPEGRMALLRRKPSFARDRAPGIFRARMARARAISTARLNASRRLQLRPIDLVVYEGPYRRENSSRRRLPA